MRIFAAAFAVLALTGIAMAQDPGPRFDHNGSIMQLYWSEEGDGLSILYARPKAGLGVPRDALLFSGAMTANGHIYGTARVFKSSCNPGEYEVTGRYEGNDIVLEGEAPIWNGCSIVGFKWDSQHSTLRFHALPD